jgi:pimeloyl-ACP methyl ester carboxylesterase
MNTDQRRTPCGVAYAVRGSGPPVLWMSGYVVPVAAFDEVLDELAEAFTVVAVDHRGSGTSRTRPLPTTTGTMAADAASVLDRLGLDSAHVVGASLGGMVAQELAIASPHRVRSLVLCSTTAGGPGAKSLPARDIVTELKQTALRVPGGRVRLRPLGALHQAAAASSHDATRRLDRIRAPTLVLHGDEDDLLPVANATWLASHIPTARLQVVRGGTHLLVLESTEARTVLRAWLDEHRLRQPVPGPQGARARFGRLLESPYRILLGQTLPYRRAVMGGLRLVRGPTPRPGSRYEPVQPVVSPAEDEELP